MDMSVEHATVTNAAIDANTGRGLMSDAELLAAVQTWRGAYAAVGEEDATDADFASEQSARAVILSAIPATRTGVRLLLSWLQEDGSKSADDCEAVAENILACPGLLD